jgi:hypothetical protein
MYDLPPPEPASDPPVSANAVARWEALRFSRVQGIGGITGKALALSIIGGAAYGVIKLIDLVTDDARARSPDFPTRNAPY